MLTTFELIGTVCGEDGNQYQYHSYILAENIDEATERADKMSESGSSGRLRFSKFHTIRPYQEKH